MRRNRLHLAARKFLLIIGPRHRGLVRVNAGHCDAIVHGADERTKVAPNTFLHFDLGNRLARHPPRAQQTAEEFAAMVAMAGFKVDRSQWITPAPWWSRRDLGLLERFGRKPGKIEATQVRIAVQR